MESFAFIIGLLLGLFLCAPIGPIGIICIERALKEGRLAGIAAVLGATTVDGIYCAVSTFGFTFIGGLLYEQRTFLRLVGGCLLVFLGARMFFNNPVRRRRQASGGGVLGAYVSTFLITLANPMPIAVFTATFSTCGFYRWNNLHLSSALLVAGVLLGSGLWAFILILPVSWLENRTETGPLHLITKFAGAFLIGFGIALGINGFINN